MTSSSLGRALRYLVPAVVGLPLLAQYVASVRNLRLRKESI